MRSIATTLAKCVEDEGDIRALYVAATWLRALEDLCECGNATEQAAAELLASTVGAAMETNPEFRRRVEARQYWLDTQPPR